MRKQLKADTLIAKFAFGKNHIRRVVAFGFGEDGDRLAEELVCLCNVRWRRLSPRQNIFNLSKHRTSAAPFSRSVKSSAAARRVISGITSSRIFISRLVKIQSNAFRMPIITTSISGKRIDVYLKDLINHKIIKQVSWINVKMWTRLNGT